MIYYFQDTNIFYEICILSRYNHFAYLPYAHHLVDTQNIYTQNLKKIKYMHDLQIICMKRLCF